MILIFDKYRGGLNLSASKFMTTKKNSLLVEFSDGSLDVIFHFCIMTLEGLLRQQQFVIDRQWRKLK